jgi:hypothetical protein
VLPQHVVEPEHAPPCCVHGAAMQEPPQKGVDPVHVVPQAPQFVGSLLRLTHFPSQQVRPT